MAPEWYPAHSRARSGPLLPPQRSVRPAACWPVAAGLTSHESVLGTTPVHVAAVWGDRNEGESGFLIKLPAGLKVGMHAHTGDYHGVLIAGTWVHIEEDGSGQDQELSPGSYVHQPGKAWHDDWCKADGADCIILIHQHEKSDFIPKETPAE